MADVAKQPLLSIKALGLAGLVVIALYAAFGLTSLMSGDKVLSGVERTLAVETIDFPRAQAVQQEQLQERFVEAIPAQLPKRGAAVEGEDTVQMLSESAPPKEMSDTPAPISPIASKKALPPAPFEGLIENARVGPLPIISANNVSPFKAYKKPYTRNLNKPAIVLLVNDYGFDSALSSRALDVLPSTISLLMSPYSFEVDAHQKAARAAGHEVWLELPMQTEDYPASEPGPKGILGDSGLKYNRDNMNWVLSRTTGYAGIAGYTSDAFDNAIPMLRGLMQDIFARGLGYFEMNVGADAFSKTLAREQASPFAKNTLTKGLTLQEPQNSFDILKIKAEQNGFAVGVVHLSPALLNSARSMILQAEQEGFEVVPLSAVADKDY